MASTDDPRAGTLQEEQQTWLQRKITGPLYAQIAAGVTPASLAQSVAMGLTVGIGPLPCLSGIIVGLLSVYCGYNMVAGQVAQLVMAPIQVAMIVPFMRCGEWMTGSEPTSLDDITRFTEGDILGSLGPMQPSLALSVGIPTPCDLIRHTICALTVVPAYCRLHHRRPVRLSLAGLCLCIAPMAAHSTFCFRAYARDDTARLRTTCCTKRQRSVSEFAKHQRSPRAQVRTRPTGTVAYRQDLTLSGL